MMRRLPLQRLRRRRCSARPTHQWTFGSLQAIWKHRDLLFRSRYGLLGWYILPQYALATILPIVFLPFIVFMGIRTAQEQGIDVVLFYFLLFLAVHLIIAAVGTADAGEVATPVDGAGLSHRLRAVAGVPALYGRLHGGTRRARGLEEACPHRNAGHRSGHSPPGRTESDRGRSC